MSEKRNDCEKMDKTWIKTFWLISSYVLMEFRGKVHGYGFKTLYFVSVTGTISPNKISNFLVLYELCISLGVFGHAHEALWPLKSFCWPNSHPIHLPRRTYVPTFWKISFIGIANIFLTSCLSSDSHLLKYFLLLYCSAP